MTSIVLFFFIAQNQNVWNEAQNNSNSYVHIEFGLTNYRAIFNFNRKCTFKPINLFE